jgi:hypothetical protein
MASALAAAHIDPCCVNSIKPLAEMSSLVEKYLVVDDWSVNPAIGGATPSQSNYSSAKARLVVLGATMPKRSVVEIQTFGGCQQ